MAKKNDELPQEFKYLDGVLKDAAWLILTEIERHEDLEVAEGDLPREIVLKINIGKHTPPRLPVESGHVVKIGRLHTEDGARKYSTSGDMGLPTWYCPNPLEYWEGEATVDYLQVKPELL